MSLLASAALAVGGQLLQHVEITDCWGCWRRFDSGNAQFDDVSSAQHAIDGLDCSDFPKARPLWPAHPYLQLRQVGSALIQHHSVVYTAGGTYSIQCTSADFANTTSECYALDTNHDGVVDLSDDPFTPFYPTNAGMVCFNALWLHTCCMYTNFHQRLDIDMILLWII